MNCLIFEEPTDFYSELNMDVSSFRQHNLELTRYLDAKPTSSLSILNSYPNIKTLFKKFSAVIASSATVERLFVVVGFRLQQEPSFLMIILNS